MSIGTRFAGSRVAVMAIAAAAVVALYGGEIWPGSDSASARAPGGSPASALRETDAVTLTSEQALQVKLAPVMEHDFAPSHATEGFIDFNQDRAVPVFSPWQGRIARVFAKAGDDVGPGDVLFTIDSPDLVTAESNLIAAAGVLQLTTRALERARAMLESQTIAQKDFDQAASDQQTAQANLEAARAAVRIFGKPDVQIERIIADRSTAAQLDIASPIRGRVTARNAAPGMLVQPGSGTAPFTVADLSTMWMIANIAEDKLPDIRLGQPIQATLAAFPGRSFAGIVSNIGATVDPNTHRVTIRSEIHDPRHELRPQMLGSFLIRTSAPVRSPAVPLSAVVREGDGSTEVFVSDDGRRFERRLVRLGMRQDGLNQILDGVRASERIATDNAIFLANELALQAR